MARRKTPPPEPAVEPQPAAEETTTSAYELPADWRSRHPKRTYPDETPQQHAKRLRMLAAEVPAKHDRWMAYADQLERNA